jgi:hypothetical protein
MSRWKILTLYLSIFAAVALNVFWTQVQIQHFCALMTTLDSAYHQNPPSTKTGRDVAQRIGELRSELHC